jgi:hypothetical protein
MSAHMMLVPAFLRRREDELLKLMVDVYWRAREREVTYGCPSGCVHLLSINASSITALYYCLWHG